MYQLSLSINETIGAYICHACVSSVDQFGVVTTVATTANTFLEVDDPFLEDDLLRILRSAERYVRMLVESPKQ